MKTFLLASMTVAAPALTWAHGSAGLPHDHGDLSAWAGLAAATVLCWGLYSGAQWLLRQRCS